MLNVLMISPDYPPDLWGGIGTHVFELASRLSDLNCSITVFVARKLKPISNSDIYSIERSGNVTVVKFPTNWNRDFGRDLDLQFKNIASSYSFTVANFNEQLLPLMTDYIKSVPHFDVLHAHDAHHPYVSIALKDLFNLPLVTTIHALTVGPDHLLDSLRRYILHNSEASIAVSASIKEEMKSRYGELTYDVNVIHNGVKCFSPEESLKRASQTRVNPKIITFCGRLVPTKGCDVLIAAFSKLCRVHKYQHISLRIIGDGSLRSALKEQVNTLKIDDCVEFLGFKQPSEVREILRASSLHIVPSLSEPFGIVALEAMAEGIPVLSTSTGGLQEIVINGWNGRTVPPNDIDALAREIEVMLSDDKQRIKYALNGIQTIQNFSWEKIAKETRATYETAIKRFNSKDTANS